MDHILFTGQKSVVTHIHHINSPFIQKIQRSNEKHTVFKKKNIVSKQLLIQSSLILPIVKPMYLNS